MDNDTKAQRFYMAEVPHRHWTPTRRALNRLGLVDANGDYTLLGLAVRDYLNNQDKAE